jgi:hypothetical protein
MTKEVVEEKMKLLKLTIMAIFTPLLFLGCTKKIVATPDTMKQWKKEVQECILSIHPEWKEKGDIPPLVIEYEAKEKIQCGDRMVRGCFVPPNTVRFALYSKGKYTNYQLIKHEFVHAGLYHYTGNLDANHSSELFLICSGIQVEN